MDKSLNEKYVNYFPYVCGLFFFFVYELSNAKGFFWGDAGEFVGTANTLGIGHAYGHPLFWLLGRLSILLQPNNPASAMNHLIVLISSATCVVVAFLVKSWCGEKLLPIHRIFIIFSVTGIFATGSIIWSQASYVEVYNVQALFITFFLLFINQFLHGNNRPNHLFAAAFFLGIAATLGMYALSIGILPLLLWIFVERKPTIRFSYLLISGICLALGLSLWLYLPIRSSLNPPYLVQNIDSLKNLFEYLRRTKYLIGDTAGFAILPLSLSKSFMVLLSNISLWGILLMVISGNILFNRKNYKELLPYFISAIFLTLFFGFLLPLNLNISQMVEMDVYLTPAFLMTIPILTIGAVKLVSALKSKMRYIIILPTIGLLVFRWGDINLNNKQTADKFLNYLNKNLPVSSVITPLSDEVSHPVYYSIYALNNPQNLSIYFEDPLDQSKSNLIKQPLEKPFLVYAHGRILQDIKDFETIKLVGPFIIDSKYTDKASKLEEEFVRLFSFEALENIPLNEKDRIFLARIWNARALYWFHVLRTLPSESPKIQDIYKKALITFYQAYQFDDFSYNGALYASNIAIMLNNAGKLEDAVSFANQALEINPYCPDAFKALYHVSINKKDNQEALENFEKYAKYSPPNGEIQMNLAFLYQTLNQPELAKKAYKRGIELGGKPRPELGLLLNE